MATENKKLLPCPFCGGTNIEQISYSRSSHYVKCVGCWTYGPEKHLAVEATAAWNRRHPTGAQHDN